MIANFCDKVYGVYLDTIDAAMYNSESAEWELKVAHPETFEWRV